MHSNDHFDDRAPVARTQPGREGTLERTMPCSQLRLVLRLVMLAGILGTSPAFAELPTPPGDITNDDVANVVDVQCSILVALWEASGSVAAVPSCVGVPIAAADINCDGSRNVIDVQALILLVLDLPYDPSIDGDGDGYIDACDPDDDDDGVPDEVDCAPNDPLIDCSGPCCEAHAGPGCVDAQVRLCVCSEDPYCCEVAWDEPCVEQAALLCGAGCPAVCGDGACDAGETCGACAEDCGPCLDCGDGLCGIDEGCHGCPDDCGPCEGACCDAGGLGCEDPLVAACVCATDAWCCAVAWDAMCVEAASACGAACSGCGDGACGPDEGCILCPEDCGACPLCGDGACDGSETCASCALDCGPCEGCGDGACGGSETCASCDADCGACVGDCCVAGVEPGCGDAAVAACLCAHDGFCCSVSWDELCVLEAELECGLLCPDACGDGACLLGETCASCPDDCGACAPSCGDGVCEGKEACEGCPADCGGCAGSCCEAHETPGCIDPSIQQCTCEQDPWCCAGEWDLLCVSTAQSICGAACQP